MAYIKFLKEGEVVNKSFPPVSIPLNKKIKILTCICAAEAAVIVGLVCIRFL